MRRSQTITDAVAMGLSVTCAIHCLLLPVALVLLPSLAALQLDNEAFHIWMIVGVIPTSAYALTLGCKTHKTFRFAVIAGVGVTLLVLALLLGESGIGEAGEKILTVIGAGFVALGHWQNYHRCQQVSRVECECPEEEKRITL
jgi:hypothetical protein